MKRELMHDPIFLAGRSKPAGPEDRATAQDLLDTLIAWRDVCVGMAANMIGVRKRIIVFMDESGGKPVYQIMLNPEIVERSGAYQTEETCLSLRGGPRTCTRYKCIQVRYQTADGTKKIQTYTGWTAQIIQHEVDHCNGILI